MEARQKFAEKKIPGGKLLKLKYEINADSQTIQNVSINGDFFLHPEDTITKIESALNGTAHTESKETITKIITDELAKNNASFIGVSADDIAETIKEAAA
jgi:lipoate-protein ligase A